MPKYSSMENKRSARPNPFWGTAIRRDLLSDTYTPHTWKQFFPVEGQPGWKSDKTRYAIVAGIWIVTLLATIFVPMLLGL
jgi:hypothetical protein